MNMRRLYSRCAVFLVWFFSGVDSARGEAGNLGTEDLVQSKVDGFRKTVGLRVKQDDGIDSVTVWLVSTGEKATYIGFAFTAFESMVLDPDRRFRRRRAFTPVVGQVTLWEELCRSSVWEQEGAAGKAEWVDSTVLVFDRVRKGVRTTIIFHNPRDRSSKLDNEAIRLFNLITSQVKQAQEKGSR